MRFVSSATVLMASLSSIINAATVPLGFPSEQSGQVTPRSSVFDASLRPAGFVEVDGKCNYKKPASTGITKRSTIATQRELTSIWMTRRYVFAVAPHQILPDAFRGTVDWEVQNSVFHSGETTIVDGGCSLGVGDNADTTGSFKYGTAPTYLIEEPSLWSPGELFGGVIPHAQFRVRQWFAFETHVGKYYVEVIFTETADNIKAQSTVHTRYVTNPICILHFRSGASGPVRVVPIGNWSLTISVVDPKTPGHDPLKCTNVLKG